MPTNPPSAAASIYPHLPSDKPVAPSLTGRTESVASAMYPRPKAKPLNPHRESLLRGLKELNAKIDARLKGERR
jgi:hypothetical protein